MLLNFAAPRTPVQAVQTPAQPATNIDALLNLSESKYEGLKNVGDTGYYYGNNRMYEPTSYSGGKGAPANMETFGEQNFVPVDADISGFNKTIGEDDIYTYDPSMAYINANRPRSMPAPTPNIMSFLSAPNMNLQPAETSYGAGRFLNNNAMPLNFEINPSQINTNSYQPTMTAQDLSNIVSMGKTNYDLSKAQGNVIQQDDKLIFGDIVDMFRTVQPNPNIADNGRITFGNPLEAAGYVAQNTFGLNNE